MRRDRREGWATVAFVSLSTAVLVLALLVRGGTESAAGASGPGPLVAPAVPVEPVTPSSHPDPPRGDETPVPEGEEQQPPPRTPGPCERVVPVFAPRGLVWNPAAPMELVRALTRLPEFPAFSDRQTLRYRSDEWIGEDGEHVFSFYERRMEPIDFWEMPADLRRLIGVRARGEIDSPPLLYVGRRGAVLLQFMGGDGLVTLFC